MASEAGKVNLAAIERVLAVAEAETDDHVASHYVLCRKVLREPSGMALTIAHRFRHVPLTREKCERVAIGWWDDEAPDA